MKEFLHNIKQIMRNCIDRVSSLQLCLTKSIQKRRFEKVSAQCLHNYKNLCKESISKYLTEAWEKKCQKMERIMLPTPDFSFLRDPEIQATMTLSGGGEILKAELSYCEKRIPPKVLRPLLKEDYVGHPVIRNYKYLTSHTRIHHLYHLLKFESKTKKRLEDLTDIIEWGGGYGDMALLLRRINSSITYTIIDIPLFSCIQWIYLVSILPEEQINLIQAKDEKVKRKKINLLPLCFLEFFEPNSEMFIATWSLSESTNYAMDYASSRDFFKATHFLLAYQDNNKSFPNASRIGKIAIDHGGSIEPNELFPGNYYSFK